MQSDKKKVLTNSLMYTSGNILLKFFSFLLIPLYTAFLSPEQYGVINLATGFISLFSLLIMAGLQYSVIRFYTEFRNNHDKVRVMTSTVLNAVALFGIVGSLILFASQTIWRHLVFDAIPFFPIVFMSILISIVSAIYSVYQELLKGMQQAKKSVILSYVFFLLMLGSNILTVVILKKGASGILISTLVVNSLMLVLMMIDLRNRNLYKPIIDVKMLTNLFKYSLPLVPHTLSYSISSLFSRVIINARLSTSVLGLYSLASQFGGVADVVSNSVQSAFQPWLFSKMEVSDNKEEAYDEIRNLTNQLLLLYGLIYLLIGCFAKEVIDLMAPISYQTAWKYVPFLVMTVAIKSPLYFYQNFMYYYKQKTKYVFVCTVSGSVIYMALVWYMTPVYAVYGTIIADLIALSFRLFLTKWILRDTDSVYDFSRIILVTLFTIIWLALAVLPSYIGIISGHILIVLYKVAMIICYCAIVMIIFKNNLSDIFLKYRQKNSH